MAEPVGRMSAVMQELVSGARSARDGVINTLDAVGRQTRAANAVLVEQVRELTITRRTAEPEQAAAAEAAERDTRFDPEDEWELPIRTPAAVTPPPHPHDDDGDDGFAQTWLR